MTTINKILDKIHPKRQYNGIQEDNRPQSEKDRDYKAEEVFAAVPPVFRVVNDGDWAKYQVRAQDGSGSCVANTIAKMFEVMYKLKSGISIKFSHAPIYINRVNKPNTGMVGTDALDLAIKIGTCKEIEMPSENKNDQELDAMTLPDNYDTLTKLVHPRNRLVCPVDFDYVASMVNKLGCAMVWVDTSYSAWCKDIPTAGGKGGGVISSTTLVVDISVLLVKVFVEDIEGITTLSTASTPAAERDKVVSEACPTSNCDVWNACDIDPAKSAFVSAYVLTALCEG